MISQETDNCNSTQILEKAVDNCFILLDRLFQILEKEADIVSFY